MDPRQNPYAPGAGTPPPALAGRDALIERAAIALDRIRNGHSARGLVLYGLRGVGKTVLLNRIRQDAESRGIETVKIEAPEGRSLPAILAPALRTALLRLDRLQLATVAVRRALRALGSFVGALKVTYGDVQVSVDLEPEPGLADTGDLEADLSALFAAVGMAARESKTAVALFIDELQYVAEPQLASMIAALHDVGQAQWPVTLMAAGLPQLVGQAGQAKSYAERLFEFVPIDRLDDTAAAEALTVPAGRADVAFAPDAIAEILCQTQGYPYFLQEWGKHAWDLAIGSPITRTDAEMATVQAIAELDASFFRVRLDRLTPKEKQYLRAMAELGPGPHRSGLIADQLRKDVTAVSPLRSQLVGKGMIFSAAHGDTAFTVPLFDGFMKREFPDL